MLWQLCAKEISVYVVPPPMVLGIKAEVPKTKAGVSTKVPRIVAPGADADASEVETKAHWNWIGEHPNKRHLVHSWAVHTHRVFDSKEVHRHRTEAAFFALKINEMIAFLAGLFRPIFIPAAQLRSSSETEKKNSTFSFDTNHCWGSTSAYSIWEHVPCWNS